MAQNTGYHFYDPLSMGYQTNTFNFNNANQVNNSFNVIYE